MSIRPLYLEGASNGRLCVFDRYPRSGSLLGLDALVWILDTLTCFQAFWIVTARITFCCFHTTEKVLIRYCGWMSCEKSKIRSGHRLESLWADFSGPLYCLGLSFVTFNPKYFHCLGLFFVTFNPKYNKNSFKRLKNNLKFNVRFCHLIEQRHFPYFLFKIVFWKNIS